MPTINEYLVLIDQNKQKEPGEILQVLLTYTFDKIEQNSPNYFAKTKEHLDNGFYTIWGCSHRNSFDTIMYFMNVFLKPSYLDKNSDWHNLLIAFFVKFPEHFAKLSSPLQNALMPSLTDDDYQSLITNHTFKFYTTYPDVAEGMIALFPYAKKLAFCQSLTDEFQRDKELSVSEWKYQPEFMYALHREHKNESLLVKFGFHQEEHSSPYGWDIAQIPDRVYVTAFKELKTSDQENLIDKLTAQPITQPICELLILLLAEASVSVAKRILVTQKIIEAIRDSHQFKFAKPKFESWKSEAAYLDSIKKYKSNKILSIINRLVKNNPIIPATEALNLLTALLPKLTENEIIWKSTSSNPDPKSILCLYLIKLARQIPETDCLIALLCIEEITDPTCYSFLSHIAYELILCMNTNTRNYALNLMIERISFNKFNAEYARCVLTRSYFLLTQKQRIIMQEISHKVSGHDNYVLLTEFFRYLSSSADEKEIKDITLPLLDKPFQTPIEEFDRNDTFSRWIRGLKESKNWNNHVVMQVTNDFVNLNCTPKQKLLMINKLKPLLSNSFICRRTMTLLLPELDPTQQSSIALSLLKNIEHCENVAEAKLILDAISSVKLESYDELIDHCCHTLIPFATGYYMEVVKFTSLLFHWFAKIIPNVFENSPQALDQLAITLFDFIQKENKIPPLIYNDPKGVTIWKPLCAAFSTLIPLMKCKPHSENECKGETAKGIYRDDFILLLLNKKCDTLDRMAMRMDLIYQLRSSIPDTLNPELGKLCYFTLSSANGFWEYSQSYHGLIAEAVLRNIPIVPYDDASIFQASVKSKRIPDNHWDIGIDLLDKLMKKEVNTPYYEPGCVTEIIKLFGYLIARMNHSEALRRMMQLKALATGKYKPGKENPSRPIDNWVVFYLIETLSRHIKQLPNVVSTIINTTALSPDCANLVASFVTFDAHCPQDIASTIVNTTALSRDCANVVASYVGDDTQCLQDPDYAERLEPGHLKYRR